MDNKQKLREQIAKQTEEFLARGGEIEIIPPVIFCPKSMQWARDRGWSYVPWDYLGDPMTLGKEGLERLGENNYHRPAAPTEE